MNSTRSQVAYLGLNMSLNWLCLNTGLDPVTCMGSVIDQSHPAQKTKTSLALRNMTLLEEVSSVGVGMDMGHLEPLPPLLSSNR